MRKLLFVAGAAALMAACSTGEKACEDYVEAYNGCLDEWGTGSQIDADNTGCDLVEDESADFYDCLADAYGSADCSTEDGWETAVMDAADCTYITEDTQ